MAASRTSLGVNGRMQPGAVGVAESVGLGQQAWSPEMGTPHHQL